MILLPAINAIESICAEAITRSYRKAYQMLTTSLTEDQKIQIDSLLHLQEPGKTSKLTWLRQTPGAPNAKHMLEHINRLHTIEALDLPEGIERQVHKNRLLKLTREGAQMTA